MNERTGKCLCGQVSYRITADPVAARICWCHDCQRLAANGTANAVFPTSAIEVSGNLSEYRRVADSGSEVTRRFCTNCGSHMLATSSARPQFTVVRIGKLDDPSALRPAMNIWTASAPAWACLDPALERVEGQPAPPAKPPVAT